MWSKEKYFKAPKEYGTVVPLVTVFMGVERSYHRTSLHRLVVSRAHETQWLVLGPINVFVLNQEIGSLPPSPPAPMFTLQSLREDPRGLSEI